MSSRIISKKNTEKYGLLSDSNYSFNRKYSNCIDKSLLHKKSTFLSRRIYDPLSPRNGLYELEKLANAKDDTSPISLQRKNTVKEKSRDNINYYALERELPFIINLPKQPFGKPCAPFARCRDRNML